MPELIETLGGDETWVISRGVKRGETWEFSLKWVDTEVDGVRTYVDLSAYTARLSVRPKDKRETVAVTFTLSSGSGITLADSNETLMFRAVPALTELLLADVKYKGDIRLSLNSNPTIDVRFPIRRLEFKAQESQTDAA